MLDNTTMMQPAKSSMWDNSTGRATRFLQQRIPRGEKVGWD